MAWCGSISRTLMSTARFSISATCLHYTRLGNPRYIFQADTSNVSSTVNDEVDSKTPEASQTQNAVIKEKGVVEVSLQELYAKVLPKLKQKGFFDEIVDVTSSNAKFGIRTSLESAVHSFKSVLEQRLEIPAGRQCLICHGNTLEVMEDHRALKSYGLTSGHNVYLIVLGGPLKPQETLDLTTALAFHARYFQGLYDSDPYFRELLKYPNYFRQFYSDSPMTDLQMMTMHQFLASGVRQQQTQTKGETGKSTAPNKSNGNIENVKSSSSDRRNRRHK